MSTQQLIWGIIIALIHLSLPCIQLLTSFCLLRIFFWALHSYFVTTREVKSVSQDLWDTQWYICKNKPENLTDLKSLWCCLHWTAAFPERPIMNGTSKIKQSSITGIKTLLLGTVCNPKASMQGSVVTTSHSRHSSDRVVFSSSKPLKGSKIIYNVSTLIAAGQTHQYRTLLSIFLQFIARRRLH